MTAAAIHTIGWIYLACAALFGAAWARAGRIIFRPRPPIHRTKTHTNKENQT